ncbi:MAG: VOC family protein [Burkholderiaceae bacterium]|jgi:catechol-2,3-dioxygenase
MNLKHLHIHVRNRQEAVKFYADWFGLNVSRSGEAMTFMTDEEGFELTLMDDSAPYPMPAWFHFGFRLATGEAVADLYHRMERGSVTLSKGLYEDESLVSFRCADPDGYNVEVYWEPQGVAA